MKVTLQRKRRALAVASGVLALIVAAWLALPAQATSVRPRPATALAATDTQALRDQAAQQLILCKAEAEAATTDAARDWASNCYAAALEYLAINPTTQPPITATPPSASPSASPTTLPPTTVPPSPPSSTSPTPSPTTQPNQCMAVPHVCGFPDATNTGALVGQGPGMCSSLIVVQGTLTVSAGQTVSCRFVVGDINVTGNNAHLVNIHLVQTNPDYGIRIFNRSGVTLSHIEIDQNHNFNGKAAAFDGYAMDHAYIHNGSDCAHLGDNASVVDSFCSLGPDGSTSTSWCNGAHVDGFQTDGGSHQTYRHNTIRNPCGQTSAILIDSDLGPVTDVHIVDNLAAGGGYVIYCNARSASPAPVVEFSGNRIAKTYFPAGGSFGPLTNCPAGGAVWDETGLPI